MMLVPVLNITSKITTKEGNLTPEWSILFTQLFTQMQINLSNDGLVTPSLTGDSISENASPSNPSASPNGTLYYNTDTQKLNVKINGVVKEVLTT